MYQKEALDMADKDYVLFNHDKSWVGIKDDMSTKEKSRSLIKVTSTELCHLIKMCEKE